MVSVVSIKCDNCYLRSIIYVQRYEAYVLSVSAYVDVSGIVRRE